MVPKTLMFPGARHAGPALLALAVLLLTTYLPAQDGSTAAIRGTVSDRTGARMAGARVTLTDEATRLQRTADADADGAFAFNLLPPGMYTLAIAAPGMAAQTRSGIRAEVGSAVALDIQLLVAGTSASVTVRETVGLSDTAASVSTVIDSRALEELPLNGRRFSDLALLSTGVTTDPRSLTSASNGDLAFGGIRGFQTSFLVDGADNNNAFFSQARGRYRAAYQFSNEMIREFRVSTNTFGAELGRAGGAVVNIVTKSGTNDWHGSLFYFLRDQRMAARYTFLNFRPPGRQQQFGGTIGGPLVKQRTFFLAGYDQHVFHVPTVVEFLNGQMSIAATPADYETKGVHPDQALVTAAAADLTALAGDYASELLGNTGFIKVDFNLAPRHQLTLRVNTSRYYGANNVFFDPASPVTTSAMSENGEEEVATENASAALTSLLTRRLTSHFRAQFSRDVQQSWANSATPMTKIYDVIEGMGRSSILPRNTREHRLHLAETMTLDGGRQSWKFGGDASLAWIYNFFPRQFGGEYIFDNIRVNPFYFVPSTYGMRITPLRAYAHQVPRYYLQNFGVAAVHPDTNEYSAFVQDSIRLGAHLAVNLGVRYDLQTFNTDELRANPLWPATGKIPVDTNNVAPRIGLALSVGGKNPVVFRGGYGIFYTRIPQMYTSSAVLENGLSQSFLFLDNLNIIDRLVFPKYPTPLVNCAPASTYCAAASGIAGHLTTEISAFAPDFQTPLVQQASLSAERTIFGRTSVTAAYLYVHGEHLIRARDVNLPRPTIVNYPVLDDNGTFTGTYESLASFGTWQTTPTFTCPFPPCINDPARPVAAVGAINVFESSASSVYNGLSISVQQRFQRSLYLRIGYAWAKAIDDGQDALVAGRPALVQNAYDLAAERALSVTDQRQRFVASWSSEPRPFDRAHPLLQRVFNRWRFSGIVTVGSGRPYSARIVGDANRDDNSTNDRLPGVARNSLLGPDYFTSDLRLTRLFRINERFRLDLMAEGFNVFNRANKRIDMSDDGFQNTAAEFVPMSTTAGGIKFPGYFLSHPGYTTPAQAYAPRQVQLGAKLRW
jgi:carboxypeptidase family protein